MLSFNQIIINENFISDKFNNVRQTVNEKWQNIKDTTNNAWETTKTVAAPATSLAGLSVASLGSLLGIPGSQSVGATLMATGNALTIPDRLKNVSTMAKNDFKNRQQQATITPNTPQQTALPSTPQIQKPLTTNNTQQK